MFVVFSTIFVADTKIIPRHDFVAPLRTNAVKESSRSKSTKKVSTKANNLKYQLVNRNFSLLKN